MVLSQKKNQAKIILQWIFVSFFDRIFHRVFFHFWNRINLYDYWISQSNMFCPSEDRIVLGSKENLNENMASFSLKVIETDIILCFFAKICRSERSISFFFFSFCWGLNRISIVLLLCCWTKESFIRICMCG